MDGQRFDCASLDMKPGMGGAWSFWAGSKECDFHLPVAIMAGFPSLDAAMDTMRPGGEPAAFWASLSNSTK
jgi:hypothetical protein